MFLLNIVDVPRYGDWVAVNVVGCCIWRPRCTPYPVVLTVTFVWRALPWCCYPEFTFNCANIPYLARTIAWCWCLVTFSIVRVDACWVLFSKLFCWWHLLLDGDNCCYARCSFWVLLNPIVEFLLLLLVLFVKTLTLIANLPLVTVLALTLLLIDCFRVSGAVTLVVIPQRCLLTDDMTTTLPYDMLLPPRPLLLFNCLTCGGDPYSLIYLIVDAGRHW